MAARMRPATERETARDGLRRTVLRAGAPLAVAGVVLALAGAAASAAQYSITGVLNSVSGDNVTLALTPQATSPTGAQVDVFESGSLVGSNTVSGPITKGTKVTDTVALNASAFPTGGTITGVQSAYEQTDYNGSVLIAAYVNPGVVQLPIAGLPNATTLSTNLPVPRVPPKVVGSGKKASPTSTSSATGQLPKTGGGPLADIVGGALLMAGGALALRRPRKR